MPKAASNPPHLVECRITPGFVGSLATSLRANHHLRPENAGDPEIVYSGRTVSGSRVELRRSGALRHQGDEEIQALLAQAIAGILPIPKARYLLGIDESGTGGESSKPHVAVVLISAETAADLIAAGVRDCKKISSDEEIDHLAALIERTAVTMRTAPILEPSEGSSFSKEAAKAAASLIRELADQGYLVRGIHLQVDHLDSNVLQQELGETWKDVQDRIAVEKESEQHVQVAAASIIARQRAERKTISGATSPETLELQSFNLGNAKESEKTSVLGIIGRLRHKYPEIQKWIGNDDDPTNLWSKIIAAKTHKLTVARVGNSVAGLCLTQQKEPRNAKLSTFWVEPPFRGHNIGPRLLQGELVRLSADSVRRVMVTFGHELFHSLEPFFRQFGFAVEGLAPQRYRDDAYEVVMGKRFHYDPLTPENFSGTIESLLFRMVGYEVNVLEKGQFLARQRSELWAVHQTRPSLEYLVQTTTRHDPELELEQLRRNAKTRGASPVLCSLYGFPAEMALPSDVTIIDSLDVANRFFPAHLEKTADMDIIIPIEPEYAQRLFGINPQATLQVPTLRNRADHVYYRVDRGDKNLRRGIRVFFYVSGKGYGEVRGVGLLRKVDRGAPKKLHSRYGGLGAWNLKDIEAYVGDRDAMAYVFDWFRKFRQPVTLEQVQGIHSSFNPITTYKVSHSVGDKLAALGGIK